MLSRKTAKTIVKHIEADMSGKNAKANKCEETPDGAQGFDAVATPAY